MSIEDLKSQAFSSITHEDWIEKAEASLKGKRIETLKSNTYENITLKPLYTGKDQQTISEYPGGSDFRRGLSPLGYVTNSWRIAQRISYKTPSELCEKLYNSLKKGQTALSFEVTEELLVEKQTFQELVENLSKSYPFAVNAKGLQTSILSIVNDIVDKNGNNNRITGYIGSDPISMFAEEGVVSNEFLAEWIDQIKLASEKTPHLRTVLIDTTPYHQGGANAIQELGIAAATGVFYLQQLLESGMSLKDILSKFIFKFSIGSNFFMELAKLRAARILWNKITEVYGVSEEYRGMHISAETSGFTKTVYDSHVNILRAGNEAFAAVLGGVQYLHVTPFNEITGTSPLGERLARNTQNILQQEAHLKTVTDPAGGSWYVEALTTELAEKAWAYFKQLDAQGGILKSLESSWVQNDISEVSEERKQDIFSRKQSIIGTNVYANLEDKVESVTRNTNKNFIGFSSGSKIQAIPKTRLSEPFEALREISAMLESKSGDKPQLGMICLGELKQYKPRLDFMRGFLSAGGLKVVESGPNTTYSKAKQFVESLDTKYFCLCGTNEQYESLGHEIISSLHNEFKDRIFFMAGLPDKGQQTQWEKEGIKQFIHIKSNCYETLSSILREMEVAANEVTKA